MCDELTGRLRTHEEKASQSNRGSSTNCDCCSPAIMAGMLESSPKGASDKLTECNAHIVECDHTTSVLRWRKLTDVERDDHSSGTNTKANNKSAHGELGDGVRGGLEKGANDEDGASGPDGHLSTISIGC